MDPESEVRRVAHQILGRIVSGGYPAGLRLPAENDLASELSCGRSTVREALRHLTGLGVVKSRRGSGAMVLDFRREGTPALLPWYVMAGRFDRPAGVLARELLGVRTLLAAQAVRLAARYADVASLAEARGILARAPELCTDPVAHGINDLALFRSLVAASGIWPAVWLANVFWAPMRDLHERLAGAVGHVPADYQPQMTRLLDRIAKRDEAGAEAQVVAWFSRVDKQLIRDLEQILDVASQAGAASTRAPASAPVPVPVPVPASGRRRPPRAAGNERTEQPSPPRPSRRPKHKVVKR